MFGKSKPDLRAVDWRNDREVAQITARVHELAQREQALRQAAEGLESVSESARMVEELTALASVGRADPARLTAAQESRNRAVLARLDHQEAATALDAAQVALAVATTAAQGRALDTIRAGLLAGLTELASALVVAAEINDKLADLLRQADDSFSYAELSPIYAVRAAALNAWPAIHLTAAPGDPNESDLVLWLRQLGRDAGLPLPRGVPA